VAPSVRLNELSSELPSLRVESPTADGEVPFANTIEAEIEVAVRSAVEQGKS
jgi:hypothetical protein